MLFSRTSRLLALLVCCLGLPAAHAADTKQNVQVVRTADSKLEAEGKLASVRYKDGDEMMRAFSPISAALRHSIVKLDVNGSTSALATIVDTNGLALTKASELKHGKLTSWVAGGKEVSAQLLAVDEPTDLALVKINAPGLKPVEWAAQEVAVGQWTVTPGTEEVPQAVGIVSVPPRKIMHKRAYIGVTLDESPTEARIHLVTPGLGADAAGIKVNDLILAVNGVAVKGREQLVEKLREFREGQTVALRVRRDEEEFEVSVVLKPEEAMFGRRGFDRQRYLNQMGGQVSQRAEDFGRVIQHDTVLEPWLCGGPLVNLDKKVIGINIARAGRVASYALPTDLALEALVRLKVQARKEKGEEATKAEVDKNQ